MFKLMSVVLALVSSLSVVTGAITYSRFGSQGVILSSVILLLLSMSILHVVLKTQMQSMRAFTFMFSSHVLELMPQVAKAVFRLAKPHLTEEANRAFSQCIREYDESLEKNPDELFGKAENVCRTMEKKLAVIDPRADHTSLEEAKLSLEHNSKAADKLCQLQRELMTWQKIMLSKEVQVLGLLPIKWYLVRLKQRLESKLKEAQA